MMSSISADYISPAAHVDRKAPNAGTKVSLGHDAPVTQEGAGFVDPGSLAAESVDEGGRFADNRGAQPDQDAEPEQTYSYESADKTGASRQKSHGNKEAGGGSDEPRSEAPPDVQLDPSQLPQPVVMGPRETELKTDTVYQNLDPEIPS